MKRLQRSGKGSQVLLLALALLGTGIALYLTFVHYENTPLVCSESGVINCAQVLSSSYAVVPGTSLPITLPGIGWCVVSIALAVTGLYAGTGLHQRRIQVAQFAWALPGLLAVLYLVYVEIVRLHTICAWCTGFHVLALLMFLITLVQLQSLPSTWEAEFETEGEEEAVSTLPRSK
jgi:uncharacterized membrane protein